MEFLVEVLANLLAALMAPAIIWAFFRIARRKTMPPDDRGDE